MDLGKEYFYATPHPDGSLSYRALTWNALLGRAYQVQVKSDLTQTNWTNLGNRITATNTAMTAVDSAGADGQRFFRVQLQEKQPTLQSPD